MQIVDINGNKRTCLSVVIDKNWPDFVLVSYHSNREKDHVREVWYPVTKFAELNPTVYKKIKKDKKASPEAIETLGIVSAATKNTLRDKSKAWKKDVYKGFPVWIARGTGEGQVRKVVGNTKNSIKIDKEWDIVPDKTSQFVLSHNIREVKVFGNKLPGYEK